MTFWGIAGTAYLMASINDVVSCGISFFLGSKAGEWRERKKVKRAIRFNSSISAKHLKKRR